MPVFFTTILNLISLPVKNNIHYLYLIRCINLMLFKPVSFLVFLCFALTSLRAQKMTQFSSDTVKFTKELGQYFYENSANKEAAAEYIKKFEKLWKENIIAGYYKDV